MGGSEDEKRPEDHKKGQQRDSTHNASHLIGFLQSVGLCFLFILLAQAAEALTLSGATITPQPKSYLILTAPLSGAPRSKSPFSAEGPNENHLSVIFLISPLCFLAGVLPYLCFQDSLYKTSPLVRAFTKLSPSSFTLRCLCPLPSHFPTVDGRW